MDLKEKLLETGSGLDLSLDSFFSHTQPNDGSLLPSKLFFSMNSYSPVSSSF